MLSKEFMDRFTNFVKKLPVSEIYLEKYLKKLKSEGTIKGYRVIGTSRIINSISFDVCENTDYYRVLLMYDDSVFVLADVVNHNDSSDNQSFKIQ